MALNPEARGNLLDAVWMREQCSRYSDPEIAEQLGVAAITVRKYRTRLGIPAELWSTKRLTAEQEARLADRDWMQEHCSRFYDRDVAAILGLSDECVRYHRLKHGLLSKAGLQRTAVKDQRESEGNRGAYQPSGVFVPVMVHCSSCRWTGDAVLRFVRAAPLAELQPDPKLRLKGNSIVHTPCGTVVTLLRGSGLRKAALWQQETIRHREQLGDPERDTPESFRLKQEQDQEHSPHWP